MMAFFAKPLVKYGALAIAVLLLVGGVVLYIDGVRREGRKDGAATVTNAVQADNIKQNEAARREKDKANAKASDTPVDVLIDGLR